MHRPPDKGRLEERTMMRDRKSIDDETCRFPLVQQKKKKGKRKISLCNSTLKNKEIKRFRPKGSIASKCRSTLKEIYKDRCCGRKNCISIIQLFEFTSRYYIRAVYL